jgi:fatty acid desaturase
MAASYSPAPGFSLTEARAIVRDLFVAHQRIYWIDFLTTIVVGHVCFGLTRWIYFSELHLLTLKMSLMLVTFSVQCALFYRGVMFIHEIVHLPEKKFMAFRVVWNLLCGIPFLVPSFTYYTHLDHHRRRMFGTKEDGEYLPFASMSPGWILVYLLHPLWVPPLAIFRFGLLVPATWFSPRLRHFLHQRASSLVIDPSYIRPLPTAAAMRYIRLQEIGCFLFIVACAVIPTVFLHRWPVPLVVHAYLTGVVLIFLNAVRTLASHRWLSKGEEGTFIDQMLDSVTMDNDSLPAILINPVGLRYHATHHLFPSMPYHNMRAAHKRLLERLPADSPYRRTVERSIRSVVAQLWSAAAKSAAQADVPSYQPLSQSGHQRAIA